MLGISLLPLICFINKKKFQKQTLIDVLVGFNIVNIQEQAGYQHLQEVSTSQIPDKYFTDLSLPFLMQVCLGFNFFYFAND